MEGINIGNNIAQYFISTAHYFTSTVSRTTLLGISALGQLGFYLGGGVISGYYFYQGYKCRQNTPQQINEIKMFTCENLLNQVEQLKKEGQKAKIKPLLEQCRGLVVSKGFNPKTSLKDEIIFNLAIEFVEINPEESISLAYQLNSSNKVLKVITSLSEALYLKKIQVDSRKFKALILNAHLKAASGTFSSVTEKKSDLFCFYLILASISPDLINTKIINLEDLLKLVEPNLNPVDRIFRYCDIAKLTKDNEEASKCIKLAKDCLLDQKNKNLGLSHLTLAHTYFQMNLMEECERELQSQEFREFLSKDSQFNSDELEKLYLFIKWAQSLKRILLKSKGSASLGYCNLDGLVKRLDRTVESLAGNNERKKHAALCNDLLNIAQAYQELGHKNKAESAAKTAFDLLQDWLSKNPDKKPKFIWVQDISKFYPSERDPASIKPMVDLLKKLYQRTLSQSENPNAKFPIVVKILEIYDKKNLKEESSKFFNEYVADLKKGIRSIEDIQNLLYEINSDFSLEQNKEILKNAEELLPKVKAENGDAYLQLAQEEIAKWKLLIDPTTSLPYIKNYQNPRSHYLKGSITALALGALYLYNNSALAFNAIAQNLSSIVSTTTNLGLAAIAQNGLFIIGGVYAASSFYKAYQLKQDAQLDEKLKLIKCGALLSQADILKDKDSKDQVRDILLRCEALANTIKPNPESIVQLKKEYILLELVKQFAKIDSEKSMALTHQLAERWNLLRAIEALCKSQIFTSSELKPLLIKVFALAKNGGADESDDSERSDEIDFFIRLAYLSFDLGDTEMQEKSLSEADQLIKSYKPNINQFQLEQHFKVVEFHRKTNNNSHGKAFQCLEEAKALIDNGDNQNSSLLHLMIARQYWLLERWDEVKKDVVKVLETILAAWDGSLNSDEFTALCYIFRVFGLERTNDENDQFQNLIKLAIKQLDKTLESIDVDSTKEMKSLLCERLLSLAKIFRTSENDEKAEKAAGLAFKVFEKWVSEDPATDKINLYRLKDIIRYHLTNEKPESTKHMIELLKQLYHRIPFHKDLGVHYEPKPMIALQILDLYKEVKLKNEGSEFFEEYLSDLYQDKKPFDALINLVELGVNSEFTSEQNRKSLEIAERLLSQVSSKDYLEAIRGISRAYSLVDPEKSIQLINDYQRPINERIISERRQSILKGAVATIALGIFSLYF